MEGWTTADADEPFELPVSARDRAVAAAAEAKAARASRRAGQVSPTPPVAAASAPSPSPNARALLLIHPDTSGVRAVRHSAEPSSLQLSASKLSASSATPHSWSGGAATVTGAVAGVELVKSPIAAKTLRPHAMIADTSEYGAPVLPPKHAVHSATSNAATVTQAAVSKTKLYPYLSRTSSSSALGEYAHAESAHALGVAADALASLAPTVTGVHAPTAASSLSPSSTLTYQQQLQQQQQQRLRASAAHVTSSVSSPPPQASLSTSSSSSALVLSPSRHSRVGSRTSASPAVRPSRLSQRPHLVAELPDVPPPPPPPLHVPRDAAFAPFSPGASPAPAALNASASSPALLASPSAAHGRSVFAASAAAELSSFVADAAASSSPAGEARAGIGSSGKKRRETALEKSIGATISNASQPYPSPAQRRQAALAAQLEAVMRAHGHAHSGCAAPSFASLLVGTSPPAVASSAASAAATALHQSSAVTMTTSPSGGHAGSLAPGALRSPAATTLRSPGMLSPSLSSPAPLSPTNASPLRHAFDRDATSVASIAAGALASTAQKLSHLLSPQRLQTPLLLLRTTMHAHASPAFAPEIVAAAVAAADELKSPLPVPVCEVVLDTGSPEAVGSPHARHAPAASPPPKHPLSPADKHALHQPPMHFSASPSKEVPVPAAAAPLPTAQPAASHSSFVVDAAGAAYATRVHGDAHGALSASMAPTSHAHIAVAALTGHVHQSGLAAALLSRPSAHHGHASAHAPLDAAAVRAAVLGAATAAAAWTGASQSPGAGLSVVVESPTHASSSSSTQLLSPKASAQAAAAAALASPLRSPKAHFPPPQPVRARTDAGDTLGAPPLVSPSALSMHDATASTAPGAVSTAAAPPAKHTAPVASPTAASSSSAAQFSLQIVEKREVGTRPLASPVSPTTTHSAQSLLATAAAAAAVAASMHEGEHATAHRADAEAQAAAAVAAVFAARRPTRAERASMHALLTQWASVDANVAAQLATQAAHEADHAHDDDADERVARDEALAALPSLAARLGGLGGLGIAAASSAHDEAMRAAHATRVAKARERQRAWAEQQALLHTTAAHEAPRYLQYTQTAAYRHEQSERADARAASLVAQRQAQPRVASFHLPEACASTVVGAAGGFAVVARAAASHPTLAPPPTSMHASPTNAASPQPQPSQSVRVSPVPDELRVSESSGAVAPTTHSSPTLHGRRVTPLDTPLGNVLLATPSTSFFLPSAPATAAAHAGLASASHAPFILLPATRDGSASGTPAHTVPPTAAALHRAQVAALRNGPPSPERTAERTGQRAEPVVEPAEPTHATEGALLPLLVGGAAPVIESRRRQAGGGGGGPQRLPAPGEVAVDLARAQHERDAADAAAHEREAAHRRVQMQLVDQSDAAMRLAAHTPKTPTLTLALAANHAAPTSPSRRPAAAANTVSMHGSATDAAPLSPSSSSSLLVIGAAALSPHRRDASPRALASPTRVKQVALHFSGEVRPSALSLAAAADAAATATHQDRAIDTDETAGLHATEAYAHALAGAPSDEVDGSRLPTRM